MSKKIAIIAGMIGIINPVIGFGVVDFDLARAFSNPEIMLGVVTRPFWQHIGMPLFFITDILGWYVLPPLLIILLMERLSPKNKRFLLSLLILYAFVGNCGVLYYLYSYATFLGNGNGEALLASSMFAYRFIWGTLNNSWGGLLFLSIGYVLVIQHKEKRVGGLSAATGTLMLLSSISYIFNNNALADKIFVPGYLIFFPITIISFSVVFGRIEKISGEMTEK